jgi:hypothetical protein
MQLHRALRDEQLLRDLTIRQPERRQLANPSLRPSERIPS